MRSAWVWLSCCLNMMVACGEPESTTCEGVGGVSGELDGVQWCARPRSSPIEIDGTGGDDYQGCPQSHPVPHQSAASTVCATGSLSDEQLQRIDDQLGPWGVQDKGKAPTRAAVVVTALNVWTDVSEPRSCDDRVAVRALYRGRVTSLLNGEADMEFEKCQGVEPFMDLEYWLLDAGAPTVPEAALGDLKVLATGRWQMSQARHAVSKFSPWSDQELAAARCGDVRHVLFVTDGLGSEGLRTWYMNRSLEFRLECDEQ